MATPLMSLPVPVVGVTLGPTYATNVNSCLTLIDSHNHTSGQGSLITPAAINVNTDLSMNSNRLTATKAIRLDNLGASLTGAGNERSLYSVGGDLFYSNVSGAAVQLTSGITLSTVGLGAITGDYSATGADLTYSNSSKTYIFKQGTPNTTRPAAITAAQYNMTDPTVASGFSVVLSPPAGLAASYTLTSPTALPGSNQPLTVSATGQQSYGPLDTTQILDAAITNPKLRNSVALSVIGRSANSAGVPADITTAFNDRMLARTANIISFVQLTDAMVAAGTIGGTKITAGTLPAAQIVPASLSSTQITAGGILNASLAANSVQTTQILDANVTTAKIADGSITNVKIANATIDGATKLAVGSVTSDRVFNLDGSKIVGVSLNANQLIAASVTNTQIATRTITNTKRASMSNTAALGDIRMFYNATPVTVTTAGQVITTVTISTGGSFVRPIMVGVHPYHNAAGTLPVGGVGFTDAGTTRFAGNLQIIEITSSFAIICASTFDNTTTTATQTVFVGNMNMHGIYFWDGFIGAPLSAPISFQLQATKSAGTQMQVFEHVMYCYEI